MYRTCCPQCYHIAVSQKRVLIRRPDGILRLPPSHLQTSCLFVCFYVFKGILFFLKGILNTYEVKSFEFLFCDFFDSFGALKLLTNLRLGNLFPLAAGQDILMQVIMLAKRQIRQ